MWSLIQRPTRRSPWRAAVPVLVAVALVVALAVPAAASAAAFTAHLTAPNHTPIANKNWPITVTVTHGSTKLSGSVRYEFLYQGQEVSHQPGKSFTKGIYHDNLKFTSPAVGYALTLVVLVTTKYGTVDLDWAVKTKA